MRISLKKFISPTTPLAVLLIIMEVIFWMVGYFIPGQYPADNKMYSPLALVLVSIVPGDYGISTNILSLAFTFINILFLNQLNNRFTIIRNRSFLPVFIFLMMISAWYFVHMAFISHLVLMLVLMSLFVFFEMYRNRNASEQSFLGSLMIATASLLIEPVILLIPICWIGFMRFHSFSLRTFLASLVGVITPWLIYISMIYLLNGNLLPMMAHLRGFEVGLSFAHRPSSELVYLLTLVVFITIGLVGMYSNLMGDSNQTRANLNFLVFLMVASFVFSIIFVQVYIVFLPIIALTFSLLISHSLTLKNASLYSILFIILIVVNIAFVIFNFYSPRL